MAAVVVSATAVARLNELIEIHSLPPGTRERVRAALETLALFPEIGPRLPGRWSGFRFVLGPWPWMLIVYVYDPITERVSIATIQDSRSASSATTETLRGVPTSRVRLVANQPRLGEGEELPRPGRGSATTDR